MNSSCSVFSQTSVAVVVTFVSHEIFAATAELTASICALFLLRRRPTSSPRAPSISGAEPYPGDPQHGAPYRKKGRVPGAHAHVGRAGGDEELCGQADTHLPGPTPPDTGQAGLHGPGRGRPQGTENRFGSKSPSLIQREALKGKGGREKQVASFRDWRFDGKESLKSTPVHHIFFFENFNKRTNPKLNKFNSYCSSLLPTNRCPVCHSLCFPERPSLPAASSRRPSASVTVASTGPAALQARQEAPRCRNAL